MIICLNSEMIIEIKVSKASNIDLPHILNVLLVIVAHIKRCGVTVL